MRWTRVPALCIALAAAPLAAAAQTGTVAGTVVDAQTSQPLADVQVSVAGTAARAVTRADGRFSLGGVPAGSRTVRASRIGYSTAEQAVAVAAGQTATVTLGLRTSALLLEDVVVVGYGEQQRRDVTGAVSTVNTGALRNAPVQSIDQMLSGTAAGVQVTQASSAPGGGISIRVRGSGSISGSSEPLYVIDGFPIENDPEASSPGSGGRETASVPSNPLATLNPQDIESIEVLKDASATAIYGARGANGVVIITTRKGRAAGRPEISVDVFTGTQDVAHRYELLNARELAQAMNEAAMDAGQSPVFSPAFLDTLGAGTDWQDEIFRDAPVRSFNATVSGGTAGDNLTRYAVSGGYFDQQGVVLDSSFERYSLRASAGPVHRPAAALRQHGERQPGEHELRPHGGREQPPRGGRGCGHPGVSLSPRAAAGRPLSLPGPRPAPGRHPHGRRVGPGEPAFHGGGDDGQPGRHPAAGERVRRAAAAAGAARPRVRRRATSAAAFATPTTPASPAAARKRNGEAMRGRAEVLGFLNENTLSYAGRLGHAHAFDLLAGYTWQSSQATRTSMGASGFVTDITTFDDVESATFYERPTSERERWTMQSYLGRLNYTLLDRYLLTVTGRRDGSSRFGAGSKWGFFPSVALAWRVSDEGWMDGVPQVDDLKLRVSYGTTGNPGIRPYQSLARLTSTAYSFGGTAVTGYYPFGVANEELTWESTAQLNVGVDAAFLERASIAVDWYRKRTDDLLLLVDLPSESGFARGLVNAGSVENRGIEVSLNLDLLRGDDDDGRRVGWTTSFNYARNRNEVVDLGGDDEIRASTISDDFKLGGTVVRVGQPIGVFVGYATAGIVADSGQAAALSGIANRVTGQAYRPGDVLFVDTDGNDTIDVRDRTVIGSPHPDFTFGWSNSVRWRGLELSGLLQGTFGNEILNLNLWRLTGGDLATNVLRERYTDRWTPQNPDGAFPRFGVNTVGAGTTDYNDLILEDGSYLRLKTLSLSYGLPERWVRGRGFSRARVYVTGTNLATWTDYRGFDPEVSSFGVGNLNRGIDIGSYPSARSVTVGFNFAY